ncbi:MAG: phage tail protein, partial [Myxococcota bacterium]
TAAQLVARHRALRVSRLRLVRRFEAEGTWISRRLDGGAPGVQWHKVVVDADLPDGASLVVETASSESATAVPERWDVPRDAAGRPIPFRADLPDQLVQSPPGRFLWLRATWSSRGDETPSVRAIRALTPRNSPLALLPAYWQRDPATRTFTERFLALVEGVNTGIELRYEQFLRDLNPDAVSADWVDWLADLVDLSFDPSWTLARRRAVLAAAMELYRTRGTPRGLRRYVGLYTGVEPVVLEGFAARPGRPGYLGVPGTVLGCNLQLCGCAPDATPEADLYARHAHRFTVVAPIPAGCDGDVAAGVVARIVARTKPAHTVHDVQIARPDARVGLQSRVGVDLVLGAPTAAAVRVVPDVRTPVAGGVLGRDSVLGDDGSGAMGGRGLLDL